MIEDIDGATHATLHTDNAGRKWHIVRRDGGSVCLYYTTNEAHCHFVVWDSLDGHPPNAEQREVLHGLQAVQDEIDYLLDRAATI